MNLCLLIRLLGHKKRSPRGERFWHLTSRWWAWRCSCRRRMLPFCRSLQLRICRTHSECFRAPVASGRFELSCLCCSLSSCFTSINIRLFYYFITFLLFFQWFYYFECVFSFTFFDFYSSFLIFFCKIIDIFLKVDIMYLLLE